MDQDKLLDYLQRRLREPLPGSEAHEVMRAVPLSPVPYMNNRQQAKKGAVLIALTKKDDHVIFPLIKRTEYGGAHSGQISLPGGKSEADESAFETALRETEEEIGLPKSRVTVLGTLSDFHVIPSNFLVTPVVGWVHSMPPLVPEELEVQHILMANLNELILPNASRSEDIVVRQQYRVRAPHFTCEGQMVWGATAMMLNELRYIVREMVSTNRSQSIK